MQYLIAVSTRDGVMVHQHFGHTESFAILQVTDNLRCAFLERRPVSPPCHAGDHSEVGMADAVSALRDCRYVLSAKIGRGAQLALQAEGVTPLEIAAPIEFAVGKVMQYDRQRYKNREG